MLSAVVLSGGSGTRMGAEKGLLMLRGAPLVCIVADTMWSVADEVVVSVAPGMSSEYRAALGSRPSIVEDRASGIGPLEGLTASFAVAKGDIVVTSPCDTPFLRRELVRLIAGSVGDADMAVPRIGGLLEPLHAAYRKGRCLRAFEETMARGERKIVAAFSGLDAVMVGEEQLRAVDPELQSFWNLNSRDDLELAERKTAPK
ncbi:MAG: molybdenum cofactor guanylyltransferase [Thermoplasmata archaeon]|jgi:molybdopterin-guanine dinucleotide biosynthesis protein A|nr:molybdenum cofactor guanylyltransferase [Thermoplasmata archaeon]